MKAFYFCMATIPHASSSKHRDKASFALYGEGQRTWASSFQHLINSQAIRTCFPRHRRGHNGLAALEPANASLDARTSKYLAGQVRTAGSQPQLFSVTLGHVAAHPQGGKQPIDDQKKAQSNDRTPNGYRGARASPSTWINEHY